MTAVVQAQAVKDFGEISDPQVAARFEHLVEEVETGERRIDPTELEKFAHLYGKPITNFLGGG